MTEASTKLKRIRRLRKAHRCGDGAFASSSSTSHVPTQVWLRTGESAMAERNDRRLAAAGPVSEGNPFPQWFEDDRGLKLELVSRPDPMAPAMGELQQLGSPHLFSRQLPGGSLLLHGGGTARSGWRRRCWPCPRHHGAGGSLRGRWRARSEHRRPQSCGRLLPPQGADRRRSARRGVHRAPSLWRDPET